MTEMAFEVTVNAPYAEAMDRVIEALKVEGFGVLTRIVDPAAMMQAGNLAGDPAIDDVGSEAGARLRRVADALGD